MVPSGCRGPPQFAPYQIKLRRYPVCHARALYVALRCLLALGRRRSRIPRPARARLPHRSVMLFLGSYARSSQKGGDRQTVLKEREREREREKATGRADGCASTSPADAPPLDRLRASPVARRLRRARNNILLVARAPTGPLRTASLGSRRGRRFPARAVARASDRPNASRPSESLDPSGRRRLVPTRRRPPRARAGARAPMRVTPPPPRFATRTCS